MQKATVLAHILPQIQQYVSTLVEQVGAEGNWYAVETAVQQLLPQMGQAIIQGLVDGRGAGLHGPTIACACGGTADYRRQDHERTVQTSVGPVHWGHRAS